MKKAHSPVWPLVLGTGFFLGLGMPLAKAAAAAGVSAIAFTLWPTALAVLVLGFVARLRSGPIALTRERLRFALIAGLLGHALPMSAVFWLSAKAGAGFASLAFTLPPVFTLLVALLVQIERFSSMRVLAVMMGLLGALALVIGSGRLQGIENSALSWLELLLVMAIPAAIGAANVYRALKTPAGLSGEWLAALILGSSMCVLLVVGIAIQGVVIPLSVDAVIWLVLQSAALVTGYVFYFQLQRRAEPVTFSFMGYVMTLTGVLLGAVVFGESLPWITMPAVALIVLALWIIQRAKTRVTPGPLASNAACAGRYVNERLPGR